MSDRPKPWEHPWGTEAYGNELRGLRPSSRPQWSRQQECGIGENSGDGGLHAPEGRGVTQQPRLRSPHPETRHTRLLPILHSAVKRRGRIVPDLIPCTRPTSFVIKRVITQAQGQAVQVPLLACRAPSRPFRRHATWPVHWDRIMSQHVTVLASRCGPWGHGRRPPDATRHHMTLSTGQSFARPARTLAHAELGTVRGH